MWQRARKGSIALAAGGGQGCFRRIPRGLESLKRDLVQSEAQYERQQADKAAVCLPCTLFKAWSPHLG